MLESTYLKLLIIGCADALSKGTSPDVVLERVATAIDVDRVRFVHAGVAINLREWLELNASGGAERISLAPGNLYGLRETPDDYGYMLERSDLQLSLDGQPVNDNAYLLVESGAAVGTYGMFSVNSAPTSLTTARIAEFLHTLTPEEADSLQKQALWEYRTNRGDRTHPPESWEALMTLAARDAFAERNLIESLFSSTGNANVLERACTLFSDLYLSHQVPVQFEYYFEPRDAGNSAVYAAPSLEDASNALRHSLTVIAEFSRKTDQPDRAAYFEKFLTDASRESDPVLANFYSPEACALLGMADAIGAFGGMGSWNDSSIAYAPDFTGPGYAEVTGGLSKTIADAYLSAARWGLK